MCMEDGREEDEGEDERDGAHEGERDWRQTDSSLRRHFSTRDERNLGRLGQAHLPPQLPREFDELAKNIPNIITWSPFDQLFEFHLFSFTHIMAAAQFLRNGKKVDRMFLFVFSFTLTFTKDRRNRPKLSRPRQGTQQCDSERALLLPQADVILSTVTHTRGKATDPPWRLGSPRRFISFSLRLALVSAGSRPPLQSNLAS